MKFAVLVVVCVTAVFLVNAFPEERRGLLEFPFIDIFGIQELVIKQIKAEKAEEPRLKDKDGNPVNCVETPGKMFNDGCNDCLCAIGRGPNSIICTLRACNRQSTKKSTELVVEMDQITVKEESKETVKEETTESVKEETTESPNE